MDITVGQIVAFLAVIAGAITSISVIVSLVNKNLKKYMKDTIQEELKPVMDKLQIVTDDLDKVDMNSCKNYLVRFLSDVEQGNPIDEIEKERFYEQFAHYDRHGGNGYIHAKVERLKSMKLI